MNRSLLSVFRKQERGTRYQLKKKKKEKKVKQNKKINESTVNSKWNLLFPFQFLPSLPFDSIPWNKLGSQGSSHMSQLHTLCWPLKRKFRLDVPIQKGTGKGAMLSCCLQRLHIFMSQFPGWKLILPDLQNEQKKTVQPEGTEIWKTVFQWDHFMLLHGLCLLYLTSP